MKLDKITQFVKIDDLAIENFKTQTYTLELATKKNGILKINPGKHLDENRINFGAYPCCADKIANKIHKDLGLTLEGNKTIEYCVDIKTDFKLSKCKNTLESFRNALKVMGFHKAKLDIENNGNTIQECGWEGVKGYKAGRTFKLYSKAHEKRLNYDEGDLVRIELCMHRKPLKQNKILELTNTKKAQKEFIELLRVWKMLMPKRKNRYTIPTFYLIEKLEQRIVATN